MRALWQLLPYYRPYRGRFASGFALVFPFAYAPKRSVQAGGFAAPLALIALLLGS